MADIKKKKNKENPYSLVGSDPFKKPVSRRKAIGTMAAVGGVVGGLVVGGAAGVFGSESYWRSGYVPTSSTTLAAPTGYTYGTYPTHPKWNFYVINHVTTNPFFVPTVYGIADCCNAIGCTYVWTGSTTSAVSDMVNAFEAAIAAKADGIAVSLIDLSAFNALTDQAIAAGIPVIGYNADARKGNGPVMNDRMAYVGQPLYDSGTLLGQQIAKLITSTSALIALFIATPGTLNIQPRIDGASDYLKAQGYTNVVVVGTDPDVTKEGSLIDAWYLGHTDVAGMFAVDAGDTEQCGNIVQKEVGKTGVVYTGGFDLLPQSETNVANGYTTFLIDQQPYLQGWVPIQQMYLYRLSSGEMYPSDTNTSLKLVTKSNVASYSAPSRFEGSTANQPTTFS
jgi:simple sugar transport system substrate-binding protein